MAELAQTAATVSSYTKVKLPKGVRSTYTACKEAITVKEMNAICEATEGLNNLTVFKQRNISNVTAGETATFKLWTVGKRNSAVVLFRAEGATEWTFWLRAKPARRKLLMLLCPAMALTLFAWLGNCYFAEYELPLRASGGAIFCLRNICIRYLLGRLCRRGCMGG